MGKTMAKKRGILSSKDDTKNSKLSRLDLLKRKLELEQEMLEQGKTEDEAEIEALDKELEESEELASEKGSEKQDTIPEIQRWSKKETIEKVADIIKMSKQKEKSAENIIAPSLKKKNIASKIREYQRLFELVRIEVGKIVIGQQDAVTGLLRAVIADGHVLVEGVPGIAKTTLIRVLAKTTNCTFARIQFTPDLLPTDIIGISTYQEGRGFYTLKGPIFNNFVLADEINRAPPKVQSALLESMAEKQATIAKESFPVPLPFFTMATQNPLESVGTYTLPEAQMDRFLFKIYMGYPTIDEEQRILKSNISIKHFDSYDIKPVLTPEAILQIQEDAKQIYVDKKVERYIVKLVDATRFPKKYNINLGKYVEYGASPRASIGLFNASKADALLKGQIFVTPHNVKTIAYDILRHRILLSYEGLAEGIKTEMVIDELLKKVPVP